MGETTLAKGMDTRRRFSHLEISDAVVELGAESLIGLRRDADLVAVGAHRLRAPFSVALGYVVQGLISRSTAPDAVIPTPVPEGM